VPAISQIDPVTLRHYTWPERARVPPNFIVVAIFPEISMSLSPFGVRLLASSAAVTLSVSGFLACGGSNDPVETAKGGGGNSPATGGASTGVAGHSGLSSGGSSMGGASNGAAGAGGNAEQGGSAGVPGSTSGGAGGAGAFGGSAGAAGGSAGAAGASGGSSGNYPTTCVDIGKEPVIPPACATVMATKTATNGKLIDESALDTQAIQAAITACPAGQAVKLSLNGGKNALLSGPLTLKSGVTLQVDAGVTLFASRNPRDFDAKAGACSTGTGGASNCLPLIAANNTVGAGVMGEGTIDGRGGEPIIGQEPLTWWVLNDDAHLAGSLTAPRLIQTSGGKDFTIYKTHFQNAPKFHIVIGTTGYVVWGITVNTDPNSPNTDGVDPSNGNGLIAYSTISTGDDNVAIKGSAAPIDNIIVVHNHFLKGHGMSIGSETSAGVKNVKVCDLSLDGTGNGLRIKSDASRGGLVQAVSYTDVCMRNVRDPFVFDAYYSSATGSLIPNFQNISLHNVHVLGGGTNTFRGYDGSHITTISLDNVILDDAGNATFKDSQTAFTFGPGPVNFTPSSGTGVSVAKNITNSNPPKDCSAAWLNP